MKTMIVAHGHPTLHKGGGEVAAYSLHRMLRAKGHQSVFVGWGGQAHSANGGSLTQIGEDDYLLFTESEHFRFSSMSPHLAEAFEVLLDAYQPHVVHFHHYLHLGIEAAAMVKKIRPKTKVVLTLHEYLAICANNGQFFTKTNEVCSGYAPERCTSKCFPHIKPTTFFMREIAIKSALSFVDEFISPSRFLADQYIGWGIPEKRMSVVENPLIDTSVRQKLNAKVASKSLEEIKIGFFGQINFYKGLDIVVSGVELARRKNVNVSLGIHGNFSAVTGEAYVEKLKLSMETMGAAVSYHGPYIQADVKALMNGYHFVVMGSRWYENSPVVIQEAIHAGVPLIVPGHGGMVEKAGDVGLSYRPGDAADLAAVLGEINQTAYQELMVTVRARSKMAESDRINNLRKVVAIYS